MLKTAPLQCQAAECNLAISDIYAVLAELTDVGQAQAENLHTLLASNSSFKTVTGGLPTRAVVSPLSRLCLLRSTRLQHGCLMPLSILQALYPAFIQAFVPSALSGCSLCFCCTLFALIVALPALGCMLLSVARIQHILILAYLQLHPNRITYQIFIKQ